MKMRFRRVGLKFRRVIVVVVVGCLIVIVIKFWAKLVSCAATQVTVVATVLGPVRVAAAEAAIAKARKAAVAA